MFPSGPLRQAIQPDKQSVIAYATDATHQPTGYFSIGFKENETFEGIRRAIETGLAAEAGAGDPGAVGAGRPAEAGTADGTSTTTEGGTTTTPPRKP